jgi:hypothetical protein
MSGPSRNAFLTESYLNRSIVTRIRQQDARFYQFAVTL